MCILFCGVAFFEDWPIDLSFAISTALVIATLTESINLQVGASVTF